VNKENQDFFWGVGGVVDTRTGNVSSVFIMFKFLCFSWLAFDCLFCILLWVRKRCCLTNGRIVISGNIRQKKFLSRAVLRNKENYSCHTTGSTNSEKYIFAKGAELIFYNESGA
jgi:hypothetical protein